MASATRRALADRAITAAGLMERSVNQFSEELKKQNIELRPLVK